MTGYSRTEQLHLPLRAVKKQMSLLGRPRDLEPPTNRDANTCRHFVKRYAIAFYFSPSSSFLSSPIPTQLHLPRPPVSRFLGHRSISIQWTHKHTSNGINMDGYQNGMRRTVAGGRFDVSMQVVLGDRHCSFMSFPLLAGNKR